MPLLEEEIGFIGGGNMARMIVEGILKKGVANKSQIIVSARSEPTLDLWKALGVRTTHSNSDVIKTADIVFLTVKPAQLESALENVTELTQETKTKEKTFVSVMAGIRCSDIYARVYKKIHNNPIIIRAMPNVAAAVGESCTAISPHPSVAPGKMDKVRYIFQVLGKCEIVPESLMSAVTGLGASGPAYVFTIIDALSDGGVKQGLGRDLATTFAAQMVLGSAKMVLETKKHPAQLKDEVCSPGGTTIHAVHVLEKGNLRATLMSAVEMAARREEELSRMGEV